MNKFLSKVKLYDNIRNPTGIYKVVRDFAMQIGTYYDKDHNPLTPAEVKQITLGIGEAHKKISYYKTYNPKHYVIILTDHISLLSPEQGESLQQTISKFSSKYCLHFRDKFGFTPVVVQQQAAAKEQVESNYRGQTIAEKLEPSLEGLGDSKVTGRDYNLVIGLFSPYRYKIEEHSGYNIKKLKNFYRSINIIKNRDGLADFKVPVFFDGATNYFQELPKSDDIEGMQRVYNYIETLK